MTTITDTLAPGQKLLTDIKAQIDKYEKIYKTSSIDTLLNAGDWFAIQATRLSELLAEIKTGYNKAYYIRKLKTAQKEQELINKESLSAAKAASQSIVATAEFLDSELEYQSVAYRLEIFLKQLNILISSIQQRISYLKIEMSNNQKMQL
jgi:hypothetical protein